MSNEVYNINKKTTKLPPHFLEQRISVKYNELSVIIFYYGINLDIPFTTINDHKRYSQFVCDKLCEWALKGLSTKFKLVKLL